MDATRPLTMTVTSPKATAALAQALAPHLKPGDVLLLDGPIGAGKTHFARALIQSRMALCGQTEDVPSPTFTLVQTYELDPVDIWHADLYRLTDPGEVIELGLDEAFDTAICLVEWPDRLGELTPEGALTLRINALPDGESRELQFSSSDDSWQSRLTCLTGGS